MKKKVLLAVIPALMVLSSCTFMASATAVKGNDFLEDCLAHEEIFGSVEEGFKAKKAFGLNPGSLSFENNLTPEFDPEESFQHPSIGVQTFYDSSENKVSFRFVAVVHFDGPEAREISNAVWTRTVSKTDASSYPLDNDVTPAPSCTKAYLALSNNGGSYSISDYNNDHKNAQNEPAGYTHFVVYTLRNIDLSKYAGNSYYVSAYLTMSGAFNSTSKAIAIRFDREKKYTYVHNVGSAFMEGTVNSAAFYRDATTIGSAYGNDVATFADVALSKDDKVVIKEFDGTKLKIRNTLDFNGDNNHSDYYLTNDNGEMKTKFNGTYDFYLNSSHQIYVNADSLKRPIYAKPTNTGGLDGWWGLDGRWTALYAYDESVQPTREKWFILEADGDYLKTTEEVDSSLYNKAIFVEMRSGTSEPSWSNKNGNNETTNKAISLDYMDCAYLKDDGWGTKYFDWGPRS